MPKGIRPDLPLLGRLRVRTLQRRQSRRRNWWLPQVRCLLKTEGKFYQLGLRPRATEKLHTHWHTDRSVCCWRREAGWHFDRREACQSRDNAIAVFLKRCPDR